MPLNLPQLLQRKKPKPNTVDANLPSSDINLFSSSEKSLVDKFVPEHVVAISSIYKKLTVFLAIVISLFSIGGISMYFYDSYLTDRLNSLSYTLTKAVERFESYGESQRIAMDMSKRIGRYRQLEKNRSQSGTRTKYIFENQGAFIIEDFSLEKRQFRIQGTCPTPLECTRFISALLDTKEVLKISIKGASFSIKGKGLDIDFNGEFK